MRLPRTSSINQRAVFARVKKTGHAKAGRFLILSTLEDTRLSGIRTGFITTKRCGKAHDRVLLRRRFRALVQTHAPDFFEIRRYLVTIARADAATATFAELEADWVRQARRLGILPRPDQPKQEAS
jgi:ribonuclease P protein component